jgi:dihydroxyacetone kinase
MFARGNAADVRRRWMVDALLDRIADALKRHHEMLSELTLLAEEFQAQVVAMGAMGDKLQKHMRRLD